MENLIGKSLGRYHILEQLGEGGMATVYKAYDTNLEREVAVKIIRREAFPPEQSDQLLKRFEREAKALAQLVHPNIVNVIDYGSQEDNPYLVMNYLPGGTLKDKLGKPMPWLEAVKLLLPIAEALDYAHSRKIVHRDVKPSNILLTQRGQPMLTDFGIAKILEAGEATQLTATGVGVGTPDYMAPEQWTGMVGPQTDIYSLGVVLFQMVTGRLPYIADTPAAVLIKHARDPLPSPKSIVPDLPDAVEQLLIKALAKEPENRYRDMGAFAEALSKLTQSAPTVHVPVPESPEAFQGTLVAAPTPPPPPVPAEPGTAQVSVTAPPVARKKTWLVGLAVGLGVLVLVGAALVLFSSLRPSGTQIPNSLPSPIPPTAQHFVFPSMTSPQVSLNVGVVFNPSGMSGSQNSQIWKGVQDATSQLGVQGISLVSNQSSDYEGNIKQLIDQKQDLIVTSWEPFMETAKYAKKFPDQKFAIYDYTYPDCGPGAEEGRDCGSNTPLPNVRSLNFQTDQASFLAGYLAAGMSKTGKVGTFGGVQIQGVTLFMKGFEAGVKYYNQVHKTNIQVLGWEDAKQQGLFTGNFDSTADGYSFANTLSREGADILLPVNGGGGLGAAIYCKETSKCLVIGVDTDWFYSAPDYVDIELSSVAKYYNKVIFKTLQDTVNGKFTGGNVTYGLADGAVDLAPFHNLDYLVPEALKAEIQAVRQSLIDGTLSVDGVLGVVVPDVPQALIPACRSEGMLTIVATPLDWVNYGEIFADFEMTSGVKINSLNPNGDSAYELAAIEANKTNKGPQAPDIADVVYAYGKLGKYAGDYQPYKVSTWNKIPDTILGIPAKDPSGYWTGGYYGVMSLLVNTHVVNNPPTNWTDLLKSDYKGQIALSGDPRSSNQAIQSVFAAALANGGSLDNAQPGLDFFKKLNDVGNFVPVIANPGTVTQGATPIVLTWDYLAFDDRDVFKGNPTVLVLYPSPTIASMYVQAISAYAPHPNCAKLWMEILHSDEGQMAWMKGYVHGVNQADLEARGVIPADLKARLPASSAYASAVFPSPDQLDAAKTLITAGWMTTVGVAIPTAAP